MADIKLILGADATFEQAAQYIKEMLANYEKLKGAVTAAGVPTEKNVNNLVKSVNATQKLVANAEPNAPPASPEAG